MKPFRGAIALLLCSQILIPLPAAAQARNEGQRASHSSPPRKTSSVGRRLLRNTLIGAAIGGTLTGMLARGLGDCGDCSGDTAKAIASGAIYGALVGAAINIRPSRRPSQGPSWEQRLTATCTAGSETFPPDSNASLRWQGTGLRACRAQPPRLAIP